MDRVLLQNTNDFLGVKYDYTPPQAINTYEKYPRIMISKFLPLDKVDSPPKIIKDNTFFGVVENAAHILEAKDFEENFNKILSNLKPKIELFNTKKVEKEAEVVKTKTEQQNIPLGIKFDAIDAIKQHCTKQEIMKAKQLQDKCMDSKTTHNLSCAYKDLSTRLCNFISENH